MSFKDLTNLPLPICVFVCCLILTFIILTFVVFFKTWHKHTSREKISSGYNTLIIIYLVFAYMLYPAIFILDTHIGSAICLVCLTMVLLTNVFHSELEVAK